MTDLRDTTRRDPAVSPQAPPTVPALLRVRDVHKTYRLGKVPVPVLHGVSLDAQPGEWVAILGASGSGKSTLLHLIGGLDRPDPAQGDRPPPRIDFSGRSIAAFSARERDRYRTESVGFVFQFYHLLPELNVIENVLLGAMIRHGRLGFRAQRPRVHERARGLLDSFGLAERLRHRPAELSGGERQRVAIARALINDPPLLLADEPTGNLDRETGDRILDVVAQVRAQRQQTILMVTHDAAVATRADRIVRLENGRIAGPA